MMVSVIPLAVGALRTGEKTWKRSLEELKIRIKLRGHPDHSIIKIGSNSKKSLGDMRRFVANLYPSISQPLQTGVKISQGLKL